MGILSSNTASAKPFYDMVDLYTETLFHKVDQYRDKGRKIMTIQAVMGCDSQKNVYDVPIKLKHIHTKTSFKNHIIKSFEKKFGYIRYDFTPDKDWMDRMLKETPSEWTTGEWQYEWQHKIENGMGEYVDDYIPSEDRDNWKNHKAAYNRSVNVRYKQHK